MALLSDSDRDTVRQQLAGLSHDVTVLFFTQTFGASEAALMARRIVDELASLSDRVRVEEVNAVLEKERMAAFQIQGIPAIALLRDGNDTRMRFLGAPAGYEFLSLVEAVILAGADGSGLSDASKQLISQHVVNNLDVRVFVTPTCPHCPRAVTLAHRMAVESPFITATCVEATEFLDLSRRYRVTGVPKTIVNESTEILGALPEDAFVYQAVMGAELPE